ncbi:MAG: hypothetical protein AAFR27_12055, partial [Pseudomonadota bacterium]
EQGDNRFIVYCENGVIALDRPMVAAPRIMVWKRPIKQLPNVEGSKLRRAWAKYRYRPDEVFAPDRQTTGLNYQVEAVHAALRANQREVSDMPLGTSVNVLRIIEQVIGRAPSTGPYR